MFDFCLKVPHLLVLSHILSKFIKDTHLELIKCMKMLCIFLTFHHYSTDAKEVPLVCKLTSKVFFNFFHSISEPPTPSISPIHLPKFWRTENTAADKADDVCVMCKDFLLNALKSAQKTPTPSPNRTPIRTPSRTPTGSEQSTPTRKFSLGPAPNPPGLYRESDRDVTEFENSANQSKENGILPKDNSQEFDDASSDKTWNNNEETDVIEDIECMTICDDPDKPWGVNNDDEELEEVRKRAPQQQRRIPYII